VPLTKEKAWKLRLRPVRHAAWIGGKRKAIKYLVENTGGKRVLGKP
jgi:hypothetical protein